MNQVLTPGASTSPDTEKIRSELRMGDSVKYKGRTYYVEGISPEAERPVALRNPDPKKSLDRGCVNFEDIEGIIEAGDRKVDQSAMQSIMARTEMMIGLVGRGEAEDGVYVLRDERGIAHWDHDGNPVDPFDQDINSDERISAARESRGPNPNWWDGFEKTT